MCAADFSKLDSDEMAKYHSRSASIWDQALYATTDPVKTLSRMANREVVEKAVREIRKEKEVLHQNEIMEYAIKREEKEREATRAKEAAERETKKTEIAGFTTQVEGK